MGATPTTADPDGPQIPEHRSPGEAVALREVWQGRVWEARPATVVHDDEHLQAFFVPAQVTCAQPVDARGERLRLPLSDWTLQRTDWKHHRVLSFAFPETPYAVLLSWEDASDAFRGYYLNLQSPLRPTPVGYDTVEHILDVTIPADRSTWAWKDEDELALAVGKGLFTEDEAAWFRHWGERGVEHVLLGEPPFDQDWTSWRPDPAWEPPVLPEAWDLAPV